MSIIKRLKGINNLLYRSWSMPDKNKASEIQIYFCLALVFILEFSLEFKRLRVNVLQLLVVDIHKLEQCDHAGFYLELSVLNITLLFNFNDTRHWDYDNNTFLTEN